MQTRIKPQSSLPWVDWKLVYQYRDLLGLWVKRDIASKYRQTFLGPLWFVFHPLVTATVFVLIFARGLQIETEGVPPVLFYLTGLLIWNYVSQALNSTSMTLVSHSGLFKKVFFPRVILPFSYCVSSLVSLGIQLGVLSCFYLVFVGWGSPVRPTEWVLLFPFLIAQTLLLSFGLGLWIAALTVRFRDFHHVWALISPLWLYATPISYPLSALPESWHWALELIPLTSVVEGLRLGVLGTGTFHFGAWAGSVCITLGIALTGLLIFQKVERSCVDSL